MNAAAAHHPHHPHFGRPLCRDDLVNGSLRAAFLKSQMGAHAWTDEQMERSVNRTLASMPEGDIWVFAYGSLIWNPIFPFVEKRLARVYGYHRSLCLWSRVGRGTPDHPGLVLALDNGGACAGLAYRIAAENVREEMRLLWRREMVTGSYIPTWVKARTPQGAVAAIAFVMNHRSVAYAGKLAAQEAARCIASASGLHGACSEYLTRTLGGLREHGIEDPSLCEVELAMGAVSA